MENDNYLTKGELITGLFAISLPKIASNLLQSVLEIVDMYFVGRTGAEAIAGDICDRLVTATTAFIESARTGLQSITGLHT